jgi:hypothetical protein
VHVKGTSSLVLYYGHHQNPILTNYIDSNWAGDSTDCWSTSGHIFSFGNSPIMWSSKKNLWWVLPHLRLNTKLCMKPPKKPCDFDLFLLIFIASSYLPQLSLLTTRMLLEWLKILCFMPKPSILKHIITSLMNKLTFNMFPLPCKRSIF